MPSTPASRAFSLPGSFFSPPSPPSRECRVDSDDIEDITEDRQHEDAVVINIDLVHPKRNREVFVYSLMEVEHNNCVYNCFNILLSVDVRDAAKDICEAEWVSEREILIKMPALHWSLFRQTEKRNLYLKEASTHCPKLQIAQEIAVNDVERRVNGSRRIKHFLLRFTPGVVLSNIFDGGARKLETHLQLEEVNVTLSNSATDMTTCFVIWKVADESAARRPPVNKLADQLKRMLLKKAVKATPYPSSG